MLIQSLFLLFSFIDFIEFFMYKSNTFLWQAKNNGAM